MTKATKPRAVVLLSGGLDSATAAYQARAEGFELFGLSFDYGQRHRRELESARLVCDAVGCVEHLVVNVDMTRIGGSALTSPSIAVPTGRDTATMAADGIPPTYVPARNTIFLAYALSWAEVLGADDIVIGVNAVDYSGYPDCRPDFVAAFEKLANLATSAAVSGGRRFRIRAPLMELSKGEIIRLGDRLGVDYALTWSCYRADLGDRPCGACDSCRLRARGFAEAGVTDPAL